MIFFAFWRAFSPWPSCLKLKKKNLNFNNVDLTPTNRSEKYPIVTYTTLRGVVTKKCSYYVIFLNIIFLGVRFSFSESYHSKGEGSDRLIIAPLAKNQDTRLANPVIFNIVPLTIAAALSNGSYVPDGALPESVNSNQFSPYEASKFDVTYSSW